MLYTVYLVQPQADYRTGKHQKTRLPVHPSNSLRTVGRFWIEFGVQLSGCFTASKFGCTWDIWVSLFRIVWNSQIVWNSVV